MAKGLRVVVGSIYLPLWAVLGVISGVLLLPGAPSLIVTFTLGLGLVLLPIPTVFLYMTAALPGVLLFVFGLPWWVGALVGLLAPAWLALYPPALAQADAIDARKAWTVDDRITDLPAAPRTLRIVRWGGNRPQAEQALRHAPCEDLCQRLLYGGEADAIEVLAYDDDADDPSLPVVWRRERLDGCPTAFESAGTALPVVQRALATGDCLVPEVGAALGDVPWIRTRTVPYSQRQRRDPGSWWTGTDKVGIVMAGPGGTAYDDPPYRHHAVQLTVARAPLALVPESTNPRRMDLMWWSVSQQHGTAEPIEAARQLFGYELSPLSLDGAVPDADGSLPAPGLGLVEALLDQAGETSFDDSQVSLVRDALQAVRQRNHLSPSQVELLDRLLRDPRIDDLYFVVDVFRKDEEAVAALLPALVARMGMRPRDGQGHTRSRIARFLSTRPLDTLRPHADALLAAAEADGSWATNDLLVFLPLIVTPPPVDLLHARLGAEHDKTARAALIGLCNTDPDLLPPEVLSDADEAARRIGYDNALAAMVRIWDAQGQTERGQALLDSLDDRERSKAQRALKRMAQSPPIAGGCRY